MNCSSVGDLRAAVNGGDWRSVDAYLCVLAKFQPSFKVVFRLGFQADEDVIRDLIMVRFPLASKRGIVKIEHVRDLERCVAM